MASSKREQQLSEVIFSWKYKEFEKYKKTPYWYVGAILLLAIAIWWSLGDGPLMGGKNYLFIIFLVIFFLVILLYDYREPQTVDFYITPDGIKDINRFYRYDEMLNFFMIYQDGGTKNLYFEFRNPLRGRLTIPLGDRQDVLEIRQYLLKFLKENLDREDEPLTEMIRRRLKF